MVCRGEVKLIVPGWLAGLGLVCVCRVLTCGSCFSAALRCRRGLWRETGGQEPAVGEAVENRRRSDPPFGIFLVIDWTCLMHCDQLNGHRCANPTPQMKQMNADFNAISVFGV